MTTLTETSYAFITNNLREDNPQSLTKSNLSRIDSYNRKYANPTYIVHRSKRGPAERRLSLHKHSPRIRNSRSSEVIKLGSIESPSSDLNFDDCYSSSRNSSPSSSSSVPLSPTTTPRAPLLGRTRTRSSGFRKQLKDITGLTDLSKDPIPNGQRLKSNRTPNHLGYFSCATNHRASVSPNSGLKNKARHVWHVLERKLGSGRGIPQSKSVGNIPTRAVPTSETIKSENCRPEQDQERFKYPDKSNVQNGKLHSEVANQNALNSVPTSRFPHSQSLDSKFYRMMQGSTSPTPSHHPCQCIHRFQSKDCYILPINSPDCHPNNTIYDFPTLNGAKELDPKTALLCLPSSGLSPSSFRSMARLANNRKCSPASRNQVDGDVNNGTEIDGTHRPAPSNHSLLTKLPSHSVCILPNGFPIQEVREVTLTRPEIGQRFGMRIEAFGGGMFLTTVLHGSAAADAGLKIGDEVLSLNDIPVTQLSANLINQIIRSTPKYLKIAYRPRTTVARIRSVSVKKIDGRVGIRLKRYTQGMYVDVVLPDSAANRAGIKEGDELLCINNLKITDWTQEDASKLLRDYPDGEEILLHLREFYYSGSLYGPANSLQIPDSVDVTKSQSLHSNSLTTMWEDPNQKSTSRQTPPPAYHQTVVNMSSNEENHPLQWDQNTVNQINKCPSRTVHVTKSKITSNPLDHSSTSLTNSDKTKLHNLTYTLNHNLNISQDRLSNSQSDYSLEHSKKNYLNIHNNNHIHSNYFDHCDCSDQIQ